MAILFIDLRAQQQRILARVQENIKSCPRQWDRYHGTRDQGLGERLAGMQASSCSLVLIWCDALLMALMAYRRPGDAI
jgi:hypothetical protein